MATVRTASRPTNSRRLLRAAVEEAQNELLPSPSARKLSRDQARPIINEQFQALQHLLEDTGDLPSQRALKQLIARSKTAARQALREAASGTPLMAPQRAGVAASEADITDEINKGGPAFGAFVKSVGLAVADAQAKLDETLVTTAERLSKQQIDVIAVFEQELNDDGTMDKGTPHMQKLPLINYVMPTAYQWTRVFLQADMKVSEFNGSNGFNIKGSSTSVAVGARASYSVFGGFSGSVNANVRTSQFSAEGETSFARDDAAGSLHLEATLEPRADIRAPQPFIVQKGPKLKVTTGSKSDIVSTATPPVTTGRKMSITVELTAKAGGPLANKSVDFRLADSTLNFDTLPSNGQTDANGKLEIIIKREGAAFDPAKPPQQSIVRVWYGLLNEQVPIAI